MPVTHAHPAAVLPLIAGRLFNAPALVIGSLMPDYPSFLLLEMERVSTHSLAGTLIRCVPAGLVVYVLYQAWLRPGFLAFCQATETQPPAVSPPGFKARLKWFLMLVWSLWLGAATHLFWDGFTHYTGWAVPCFSPLLEPVHVGVSMPLFRLLQYTSGILGTWAVAWFAWRALKRNPDLPWTSAEWHSEMRRRCLKLSAVSVVLGSIGGMIALKYSVHAVDLKLILRYQVVCITDFFLLMLLGWGVRARFILKPKNLPVT